MNIQSMVTAAASTAVCLLSLPLRGHSADESTIDTRVILADAGRAAPDFRRHRYLALFQSAEHRGLAAQGRFLDLRLLQLCQHAALRHTALRQPARTKASSSSASTRRSFLSRDQPGTCKGALDAARHPISGSARQ